MKKTTLYLGAFALILLAIALVWKTSIDRAVASAIEYYGTQALGTPVTVGWVTIRTAQGKGTIRGLQIAQPDGFGDGPAISVDEITVDFGVDSLISGTPYVIEFVRVGAPEVVYVVDENGRSNLAALQTNLARFSSSDAPDETPDGETSDLRMRIERFEVERGQVEADLGRVGVGRTSAKLPSMHLEDVGGMGGAPPGELASAIGRRFMTHTLTAVTTSAIGQSLQGIAGEGSKIIRGLLDSLGAPRAEGR